MSEALALLAGALQDQDAFDPAASMRRFRVAMTDVGEIHFMPRLIEVCAQVAPQAHRFGAHAGAELAREMEAGRVDLAIGAFDDMGRA